VVSCSALPAAAQPAEIDRLVSASIGGGQPLYRLDIDAIGDLRPDLVLAQDLCAVCAVPSGQVNQALDVLGCQAEVISLDPSSLGEVLEGVLQVGKAAGVQQRAQEVVAGLRERLGGVQAVVAGLERPRVFALEWGDPPFNGGHWVPEMLQVAGAEAVLACPGGPSVRVTWEQIEAAAPQVVVFTPCGYGLQAAVEEARRSLLGRPELAGVEAIVAVDASAFSSGPAAGRRRRDPGRGAPPGRLAPTTGRHRRTAPAMSRTVDRWQDLALSSGQGPLRAGEPPSHPARCPLLCLSQRSFRRPAR
jgi:iron complex transport system substrate-binding protein